MHNTPSIMPAMGSRDTWKPELDAARKENVRVKMDLLEERRLHRQLLADYQRLAQSHARLQDSLRGSLTALEAHAGEVLRLTSENMRLEEQHRQDRNALATLLARTDMAPE